MSCLYRKRLRHFTSSLPLCLATCVYTFTCTVLYFVLYYKGRCSEAGRKTRWPYHASLTRFLASLTLCSFLLYKGQCNTLAKCRLSASVSLNFDLKSLVLFIKWCFHNFLPAAVATALLSYWHNWRGWWVWRYVLKKNAVECMSRYRALHKLKSPGYMVATLVFYSCFNQKSGLVLATASCC